MKRAFAVFLAAVMLIGCCAAAAEADSQPVGSLIPGMEVSFDSIRELVEWLQAADHQKYSGNLREIILRAQTEGEIFAPISEENFRYGMIIPSADFIIFYFCVGEDWLHMQFHLKDPEIAEKHPDALGYFKAKNPKSTLDEITLDFSIDGEPQEIHAISTSVRMGENKAETDVLGFLCGGFEIILQKWSSCEWLEDICFANLPLDGKCHTRINSPGRNGISYRGYPVPTENGAVNSVDIGEHDEEILGMFDDVKREDWFNWAVIFTVYDGVMNGMGERSFSPRGIFTRAQMANTLWRLSNCSGYYEYQQMESAFRDVPRDEWYTLPIIWAAENGVVKGGVSGFDPNGAITRQDFAVMLHRYIFGPQGMKFTGTQEEFDETYPEVEFTDINEVSDYAKEAVENITRFELIRGRPDGSFDPRGSITRAETAVVLSRLLDFLRSGKVYISW